MEYLPAVIIIGLIGGIVAVDTTAGWQIMINQPLVTCPVIGLIFGQFEAGVSIGVLLELPWLINIPSGGKHGSEANLGAVVAAGMMVYFVDHNFNTINIIIILCLVYSLLISKAGGFLVDYVRKQNLMLMHQADQAAEKGNLTKISQLNIIGLLHSFFMGFILTVIGFSLGLVILKPIIGWIHPDFDYAFGLAKYAVFGVGFGTVATIFVNKNTQWYFVASAIVSFLIWIIFLI